MKTTKKLKLSFNKFRVVIFEQGVESPNNSTYFFKKSVYTEFTPKAPLSISFCHYKAEKTIRRQRNVETLTDDYDPYNPYIQPSLGS